MNAICDRGYIKNWFKVWTRPSGWHRWRWHYLGTTTTTKLPFLFRKRPAVSTIFNVLGKAVVTFNDDLLTSTAKAFGRYDQLLAQEHNYRETRAAHIEFNAIWTQCEVSIDIEFPCSAMIAEIRTKKEEWMTVETLWPQVWNTLIGIIEEGVDLIVSSLWCSSCFLWFCAVELNRTSVIYSFLSGFHDVSWRWTSYCICFVRAWCRWFLKSHISKKIHCCGDHYRKTMSTKGSIDRWKYLDVFVIDSSGHWQWKVCWRNDSIWQ